MVDDHKIGIIACVNNDRCWDECMYYLSELNIPEGYRVEVTEIRDAASMCSGYNEGMKASDAKYKIYMHQDVFITDKWFFEELLDIFQSDERVGMIGLAGSVGLPKDAVVWHGARVSGIYSEGNSNIESLNRKAFYERKKIISVDAIDGLLMATSKDIPWREDIFDGWDFYDVSQSREFINAGFKVVVPNYERPFVVHDDGMVLNLTNYDKYRRVFLENYKSI